MPSWIPSTSGGLPERQPLEVVEDDDAAVLLGSAAMPVTDDRAELGLLGLLGGQRPVVGDGWFGGLVDRARVEPAPGQPRVARGSATRGAATAAARRRCGGVWRSLVRARERVLEDLLRSLPIARQAVRRPVDRGRGSARRTPRRRRDRRPGHGAAAPHPCFWNVRRRGASRSVVRRRDLRAQVVEPPGPLLLNTIQGVARKGSIPRLRSSRPGVAEAHACASGCEAP